MSKHILIIGGGVIGLCTAYYCAFRGHRVTLLEREPEAHEGCSFGNAGMIVPSHFVPLAAPGMVAMGLRMMWNPESPFYIKPRLDADLIAWSWKFWCAANAGHVRRSAPLLRDLSFASRALFEELAMLPNFDFDLTQRGLLMLCKTQHALDDEAKYAAQANALGVPAEVLSPSAAATLDPGVRMDIAGAVYFPKDCHLSPGRFMAGMRAQCAAMGVTFHYETEVTGFTQQGQRITSAKTEGTTFEADEIVLCGGSWSPLLAKELGLKLPMQAGKGYSLTLSQPRQLPQLCSIFTEARMAITPMGSSLRFGGTMEIAGLDEAINPRRVEGIIKSVSRYFPDFTPADFAGIQPWSGLRPCSPDGMPYLGRTAKYANLTLATGHAMMGLSLGPITGKLVAQVMDGEKPAHELARLSPDRYA